MSPIQLFMILVALAFIGGVRASRGSGGFWGFASGIEYVTLGFLLGPRILAVVTTSAVHDFEPLLLMALGWMLAVRGAHYGTFRGRSTGLNSILLSAALTTLLCAAVFIVVRFVAAHFGFQDTGLVALGLAAVVAESTAPPAIASPVSAPPTSARDWVCARWATSTELPAVLILSLMIESAPTVRLPVASESTGLVLSIVLGFGLGGTVTALLGAHFEQGELWPILLGSVLLVVGAALKLELPAVTPAFLLGLVVAVSSQHRGEIRRLMAATEPQLRLPCLLLVGAMLDFPETVGEWLMIGAALGTRWMFKLFFGLGISWFKGLPPGSGLWLGRHLLRSSSFSIALGLVIFLRQSDELGRVALMAAVVSTVAGELFAPRKVNDRAREHLVVPRSVEGRA